jgi:hypothetical protein
MSGFLILDPRPVYFTQTGEAAAGGSLVFSMAGTATPQDVYGDAALTVNNGSTLTLGTDGRTSVEVWGDPTLSYRVQLYDANGALQFDQDNVSGGGGGGAGGSIPALLTGKFLTNDGSQLLWADIRQLPDPTGQSGKVLSTDGANFTWIAKPADGAAGAAGTNASVTVTPSSVKWNGGTGDLFFIQGGSDSAPASGVPSTSKAITFPTAYATDGKLVIPAITAKTTTGFTVGLDTNTTTDNVFAAVPFDWIAFGTIGA